MTQLPLQSLQAGAGTIVLANTIGDRTGAPEVSHLERSASGVERSLIYEILHSVQNDQIWIVIEFIAYYKDDMEDLLAKDIESDAFVSSCSRG